MDPKKDDRAAERAVEKLAEMMSETDTDWLLQIGWTDYETAERLLKKIGPPKER